MVEFFLLVSVLRHDERDTILSMLTPYPRTAHLVVFKISVGGDPKNSTLRLSGRIPNYLPTWSNLNSQLTLFQNLRILRTISSWYDVIYTPATFPVWGFIMTMVIVISFAHERKTVPNDYAPELLTRIIQSPTKLNDEIKLTKNDWYEKIIPYL